MTLDQTARRRARRTFCLTLVVARLALAACGDDDSDGDGDGDTTVAELAATDGTDPSTEDTVTEDTSTMDTMTEDTSTMDTMTEDTSTMDTSTMDTSTMDTMTDDTMSDDENEDPAADEETFVSYGAIELGFPDEDVSTCLSQALIDSVGFENVQATGLSPVDFFASPSLADTGVAVDDDLRARIQDGATACGGLLQAVAATAPDEVAATCLEESFTDELIAEQLAVTIADGEPSDELLAATAADDACRGE